jgi:hypothetical protein
MHSALNSQISQTIHIPPSTSVDPALAVDVPNHERDENPGNDNNASATHERSLRTLLSREIEGDESPSLMERGHPEYSQSGVHSAYPTGLTEPQSEPTSAAHASAINNNNTANHYASSSNATPSASDYSTHPSSARSSSFPEHIQRQQYYPPGNHNGSSGNMAQQATSPSIPLHDGHPSHTHHPHMKSDADVPIDPSIAASSPTYPPQHGQYSPYPPQQEMQHGYPAHPGGPMYAQPRPDWANYQQQHHAIPAPYAAAGGNTPTSAPPSGGRPGQVSLFATRTIVHQTTRTSSNNHTSTRDLFHPSCHKRAQISCQCAGFPRDLANDRWTSVSVAHASFDPIHNATRAFRSF